MVPGTIDEASIEHVRILLTSREAEGKCSVIQGIELKSDIFGVLVVTENFNAKRGLSTVPENLNQNAIFMALEPKL